MYDQILYFHPNQFRARAHVIKNAISRNMWFNVIVESANSLRRRPNDFLANLYIARGLLVFNAKDKALKHLAKAEKNMIPGREEELQGEINRIRETAKQPRPQNIVCNY